MSDINRIDTMILSSNHSILVNNLPNQVDVNKLSDTYYKVSNKDSEQISQFGLFSNAINYNTYYPDVTPESIKPKDDEFIEPVFRLISNCIVAKPHNPTEFPEEVLKNSMKLLVGQTVNCDHETEIANAIGSIKSVSWQDPYIDEGSGTYIPGGINAVLRIDGKSNPRIARGISMDPPSIHSNSVTVQFKWEPSHNFDTPQEFIEKLGTYGEDGTMVRRIVTEILAYFETSLVSHGADPFAQIIKDDKIVNPGYANQVYYKAFGDEVSTKQNRYDYIDFKVCGKNGVNYDTSKFIYKQTLSYNYKNENPKSMNEVETLFNQLVEGNLIKLSSTEMDSNKMEVIVNAFKYLNSKYESATEELTKLSNETLSLKQAISDLEAKLVEADKLSKIGKDHFDSVRNEAISSYKKLMGEDNLDTTIISLLQSTSIDIDTVVSLGNNFKTQLEDKFPMTCSNCGSHDINRASSISNKKEEIGDTVEEKSVVDVIKNIAKNKLK